ncbi:MAG: glutathione S-transferase C-terminal domain-containing protein [Proteobacteria bacterium]|nr:glutathione S-transferase C-terminal domain-containing protein [Pseudomonadota bacterium]
MGLLIDGQWLATEPPEAEQPPHTVLDGWIRRDGSSPFAATAGRYHLWVSTDCQWSRRVLITRSLLGLETFLPTSEALPGRDANGWGFAEGPADVQSTNGRVALHQVYTAGDPAFTGRATVPLLWDRELGRLVSNTTTDIIRMLIVELAAHKTTSADLLPDDKREEIDWLNNWVEHRVRMGCQRVQRAKSPDAAEHARESLSAAMERLCKRLKAHRYLVGDELTEADVLLYPFLTRFRGDCCPSAQADPAPLQNYPELAAYVADLARHPSFEHA